MLFYCILQTIHVTAVNWLWNPNPSLDAFAGPWTVTASPIPVSYCEVYEGPTTLCNPRAIIDGTINHPLGVNAKVSNNTAFDYDGKKGPPYIFTIEFGTTYTFSMWRIIGKILNIHGIDFCFKM